MNIKRMVIILTLAIVGKDALYGMSSQCEVKRDSAVAVAEESESLKSTEAVTAIPDMIVQEMSKNEPDYKIIYDWLGKDRRNIHAQKYTERGSQIESESLLILSLRSKLGDVKRRNFIIKLIELGADVNASEPYYKQSALMLASKAGAADIAQKLLQYGASVNYEDSIGQTALINAINSLISHPTDQLLRVIKLLINNRADVNHRIKGGRSLAGQTPLMLAFQEVPFAFGLSASEEKALKAVQLQVARLLLEHGADPNAVDTYGKSVMQYAEESGPEAVKFIKEQIARKAVTMPKNIREEIEKDEPDYKIIYDWIKRDPQNIYAKNLLVENFAPMSRLDNERRRNFIIRLIEMGADVNQIGNSKQSALMFASRVGAVDIVQKLLQHGARISYEDGEGNTALTETLDGLKYDGDQLLPTIKLLIQYGAQVNHRTKASSLNAGKTPLMFAFSPIPISRLRMSANIIAAQLQAARLLLEHGADPNAVDTNGKSVMQYAEQHSPEAVKFIQEFQKLAQERAVESKATGEGLEDKIPKPIIGIVKEYIEVPAGKKATLNRIKEAIREGNEVGLKYLMLEKGNLELADEAGYTPLLEAIYANKPELVKLLLELGADKNARLGSDKDGFNALELAQRLGRVEIIKLLRNK